LEDDDERRPAAGRERERERERGRSTPCEFTSRCAFFVCSLAFSSSFLVCSDPNVMPPIRNTSRDPQATRAARRWCAVSQGAAGVGAVEVVVLMASSCARPLSLDLWAHARERSAQPASERGSTASPPTSKRASASASRHRTSRHRWCLCSPRSSARWPSLPAWLGFDLVHATTSTTAAGWPASRSAERRPQGTRGEHAARQAQPAHHE
jgi:hypothetical protein